MTRGHRSLRFELDASGADAFSDALIEAGASSVSIEDADAGTAREIPQFDEPNVARDPRAAATAWPRSVVVALFDPDDDIDAIVRAAVAAAGIEPPIATASNDVEDRDWVRLTQAQFEPIAISDRLWIVPTWHEPPDPCAINLRLDPGRAFGTGSHPTTRLVLEWLERTLQTGASVLDYGCGSGILAIAAAALGAGPVDAVDIDSRALEASAENARANQAAIRILGPEALPARTYDIVMANILAQPLIDLAPTLASRLAPGARLALSGVLASQAAEVAAAWRPYAALSVTANAEGWVLLEGRRE